MLPIHQGKQQTNETTMNPEQPTPTPEPQTHGSPSDFKYHQTPTQRVEQQINDWHQSITPWCGLFLEAIDELRKVASELEQLQTSGVKDFNCDYKVMAQQKSAELERVQAALKCSSIMYVESCKERDDLRRQLDSEKLAYADRLDAVVKEYAHLTAELKRAFDNAQANYESAHAQNVELRKRIEELETQLRIIGDKAVVDWDNETSAQVDAVVKAQPPQTYIEFVRKLYTRGEEIDELRRQVEELKLQADVALLTAHRACGNQEQDAANGKLAGYCVVCQTPWPCDYAKPSYQKDNDQLRAENAELRKCCDGMAKYIHDIKEFWPASYNALPHVKSQAIDAAKGE
jgi:hypothetical protein